MMQHNFLTYSVKILLSLLFEILYFPIWWYSVGLLRHIKNIWNFLRNQERELGFHVWAKNILVPMYGQTDWAGRLISFLVRLVQVLGRGLILIIWLFFSLLALILWLALPLLLIAALFFQVLK